MAVTFDLPNDIEQNLRQGDGNLDQTAKEAALVELYRQRKLNRCDLSKALSLDRFETEELLHKHKVTEDLPTLEDLEADHATLTRLLGPIR